MPEFKTRYLADYQPSDYTIETVDLTFDLADKSTKVTSVCQFKRINSDVNKLTLDGEHLKLLSIQLNDQVLANDAYQLTDSDITLNVDLDEFVLTVVTEINPEENTALEGLFKSGNAFCTQCEAEGFRRITYFLDRPDVLAVYTTKVIADKKAYPYLLANGNKIETGELAGGRHFVQWHDPFPKPSYLFALVAGTFDLLEDKFVTESGRTVALEIFVDPGNVSKAHHAMESLKKSMKWDEEVFGLEYDLDIYMIVAVDFFNMGAMENKGLNVFNSKYVLADQATATDTDYFNVEAVIAHEYFHNWTGNRVTCRDWFQLSLKEGLTVFRDQQFSADMHSAAVNRIQNVRVLRAHQFAEDAGPMSHPIRPEKVMEMNNFYTLTVYEKGSEVIRMLHTLLGKDGFRAGMDLYFKRFDGQAVTCDDFVDAMADATGRDLSTFKGWYSQSGTPVINVNESYDEVAKTHTLTIKQLLANKDGELKPCKLHIPVGIEVIEAGQSTSRLLELTEEEQSWTFDNVQSKPVTAFLTGFSAPVKVTSEQDSETLTTIASHAKDSFVKWDAGQKKVIAILKGMMEASEDSLEQQLVEHFETVLNSDGDAAFKAEQLSLPSFNEFVDELTSVDPQQAVAVLKKAKVIIAAALEDKLHNTYLDNSEAKYNNSGSSIGKRSLKNQCLHYLVALDNYQHLVDTQYQAADNMEDALASLTIAARVGHPSFDELMSDFENKWQETTLVMDKWFNIQAMQGREDTLARVKALLSHPLFTLKNPNRARSLIGVFSMSNPEFFHASSGEGYEFLTEQIIAMDEINPQVASRLITSLIQFNAFNEHHQSLMKACLKKIDSLPKVSRDLREKLTAALAS